ncbi:MAG: hypothetical protein AAGD35_19625 [Actinomycetota bacterium]
MTPAEALEVRGIALQRSAEGCAATEAAVSLLVRAGLLDALQVAVVDLGNGRVEIDWVAAQHRAQTLTDEQRAVVLIAKALAGGFGHLLDTLDQHGRSLALDALRHALSD